MFVTPNKKKKVGHGGDRMVIWFTNTCEISGYHLKLWIRILLMARCIQYSIMW